MDVALIVLLPFLGACLPPLTARSGRNVCAGTTAGMAAVSALFALPARIGADRALGVERFVRVAAGVASIVIGVSIAHRVGIQDGLFAATPSIER